MYRFFGLNNYMLMPIHTTFIQYIRQQRKKKYDCGKSTNMTYSLTSVQLNDPVGNNAVTVVVGLKQVQLICILKYAWVTGVLFMSLGKSMRTLCDTRHVNWCFMTPSESNLLGCLTQFRLHELLNRLVFGCLGPPFRSKYYSSVSVNHL